MKKVPLTTEPAPYLILSGFQPSFLVCRRQPIDKKDDKGEMTHEKNRAADVPELKKTGLHYGWAVLAAGTLSVFSALGLARFGYTMVLPAMQADIGMNNAEAGLLATFNMAGYLLFSILGGALSTHYGVRRVASLGLGLAGIGMVCTGLSGRFLAFALWRGLTGIGSGGGNIAVMGLWPAWFSSRKRGLAAGVAVSGSSLGLIFTGRFVPWLSDIQGPAAWRTCWLLFGGFSILTAVASYFILRNRPSEMGLNVIGEEEKDQLGKRSSPEALPLRSVYLSPSVWALGLVYSAFGFSYVIYMTFFFKFLIQDAGYTAADAGTLFMMMGWVSLLCGIVWGTASDFMGRSKALTVVYLIQATAFGLFAMGESPLSFTLSAVLFGLSAWSVPAIVVAACGDMLGPRLSPAALGFITLFMGTGQVLGPFVGGIIADAAGSFSPAFLLAAAVAISGALGSALLVKG
ncbi:MAG: MFS transporter [Desulfobacteraceae bacterium]|nr:MAG: MFS transporter [Desulfobacteraceae bacterium]